MGIGKIKDSTKIVLATILKKELFSESTIIKATKNCFTSSTNYCDVTPIA